MKTVTESPKILTIDEKIRDLKDRIEVLRGELDLSGASPEDASSYRHELGILRGKLRKFIDIKENNPSDPYAWLKELHRNNEDD